MLLRNKHVAYLAMLGMPAEWRVKLLFDREGAINQKNEWVKAIIALQ